MTKIFATTLLLLLSLTLHGQTTYVPDDQFENYIESQGWGNGIANDNYVNTAAISTVYNLTISNLGISDLTGINDFTGLGNIQADGNNLTQASFSNLPLLQGVYLPNNQLTQLQFSGCPMIIQVVAYNNSLAALDLSQLPALKYLQVYENQLTSLDLSANTLIESADLHVNQVTTLTTGYQQHLRFLNCSDNQISTLNLINFPALQTLYCDQNQITALNPMNCPSLVYINCNNNQLLSLNISYCPNLFMIECNDNQLVDLVIGNHPALQRIYANNNQITSMNLQQTPQLQFLFADNNRLPALDISDCGNLVSVVVSNNLLSTLTTGLQPNLSGLACNQNQLTTIDLSGHPLLTSFIGDNNLFSSVDFSSNPILSSVFVGSNPISALNFSSNPELNFLDCSNSQLSSLDLSQNPMLFGVDCSNNQLNCLSLQSGNTAGLYYLVATGNPNLSCIEVDDPAVNYSQGGYWSVPAGVQFSLDCSAACAGCALAVDAGNGVTVYPGLANIHMPCQGSQMSFNCATLSATVTGATGPVSYLWSNGATTPTITVCPTQATLYSVTVTTGPGCSATDEVWVNTCYTTSHNGTKVTIRNSQGNLITINIHALGAHLCNGGSLLNCGASAKTEEQPDAILIYPNPSSTGEFYLSIPETWTGQTARILDVTGRVLTEMDLGAGNQMINLSGYSKGIYFFSTELNGETRTIRLVY